MIRVGNGFDAHRLVKGRQLILGGVEIPCPMGLEGHSDADVLTHAIIDALLGAAALGDIGDMFPDTDSKYKDDDRKYKIGLGSKKPKNAKEPYLYKKDAPRK